MRGKPLAFIILFIALLLPACIFVFLKIFGKNEFAVQPLFQDSIPKTVAPCGLSYTLPYMVPDSVLQALKKDAPGELFIITFAEEESQIQRLVDEYKSDPLQIIKAFRGNATSGTVVSREDNSGMISEAGIESSTLEHWRKCIFLLKEPFNLVLVDKSGTIRGQYDVKDRDEVDRLITELAILFKKY